MTPTQRKYFREWARRKRERLLDDKRQARTTCPKGRGPGLCGGVLTTETNGAGSYVVVCSRCERQRRGICQDCPLPVVGMVGKALRCATHRAKASTEYWRRYAERNRSAVNRRAKASYREDPAKRAARNEYKRAWRKLNREKVKAQKRRANLRGYGRDYQAKRRAANRETFAARERARYHDIRELRTCVAGCGRVVTGRKKKCSHCKEREATQALAALASRRSAA